MQDGVYLILTTNECKFSAKAVVYWREEVRGFKARPVIFYDQRCTSKVFLFGGFKLNESRNRNVILSIGLSCHYMWRLATRLDNSVVTWSLRMSVQVFRTTHVTWKLHLVFILARFQPSMLEFWNSDPITFKLKICREWSLGDHISKTLAWFNTVCCHCSVRIVAKK